MKRTRNLLAYVDKWIQIYGQRLALQGGQWPYRVLTRPVDVSRIEANIRGRTTAGQYLGAVYNFYSSNPRQLYLYLNLRSHKTRPELRDTIAHELCHIRFPYLSHGSGLDKKIKQLMAGETFKPYQPKK